jgi:hypothetical protein
MRSFRTKKPFAEQKIGRAFRLLFVSDKIQICIRENIVVFKNRSKPKAQYDYKLSVYEWKGERKKILRTYKVSTYIMKS